MNKLKKLFGLGLIGCAAFCAPRAQAQVTPTTIYTLTNLPVAMPGALAGSNQWVLGGTNQPTNQIISLRQGQGVGASLTLTGIGTGDTNTYTVWFATSLDGTNFTTTTNLYQLSAVANGTNKVTAITNWPGSLFNNALYTTPGGIFCAGAETNGCTGILVTVGLGNVVPGGFGGN